MDMLLVHRLPWCMVPCRGSRGVQKHADPHATAPHEDPMRTGPHLGMTLGPAWVLPGPRLGPVRRWLAMTLAHRLPWSRSWVWTRGQEPWPAGCGAIAQRHHALNLGRSEAGSGALGTPTSVAIP